MSPTPEPAVPLENQANSPADTLRCSTGCSTPANSASAPDLTAVLAGLAALTPEQRAALVALLSAPPSPRPTAPPTPDDSLPWEKREAKGETG